MKKSYTQNEKVAEYETENEMVIVTTNQPDEPSASQKEKQTFAKS